MAKQKVSSKTVPKQGNVIETAPSPPNVDEGGLSWPMTIIVTLIAMFSSYHLTIKFFTQIPFSDNSIKTSETISTNNNIMNPLPCGASSYMAEVSVPGLHLICFETNSNQNMTDVLYLVNIYRNSYEPPIQFKVNYNEPNPFQFIKKTLENELNIPDDLSVNPWTLYTSIGNRIETMNDMLSQSTSFLYEGGNFIWPGVKVGHTQLVPLDGETAMMETLSMKPLIFSIKNFLSHEECDYIQTHAGPHMAQSGVSLMDKDIGKAATEWRTSETYFMASKNHIPLQNIDKRVSLLSKVPTSHQELVQVLKYAHGQKYDAHHDYFDPKLYTKDKRTLNMIKHGKTNRMATVLWYLSDVEDGGHTIFPQFGGVSPPRSMSACTQGLKVSPEKGKVIMFYSLTADGKIDKHSLHGSCPVIGQKEKWAANKWVWSSPMTAWGITN